MFFLWNNCFFLVLSYQLCLLGLYVTSNVVILMFLAYFSLLRSSWWRSVFVWMTLCFFYICYYLKAALVHHVTLITSCFWWLSVYYKDTDFSTLIGWYINTELRSDSFQWSVRLYSPFKWTGSKNIWSFKKTTTFEWLYLMCFWNPCVTLLKGRGDGETWDFNAWLIDYIILMIVQCLLLNFPFYYETFVNECKCFVSKHDITEI